MATLTKRLRGGSLMFEIQFYSGGVRKTIPLGKKYTERTANDLLDVVEVLLHCHSNGIEYPGKKTVGWIESASPEIRQKLGKAGLIHVPERRTLKELWDSFLAQKNDIEESTLAHYDNKKQMFFDFFKESELLADVSKERMVQWRSHMQKKYAKTTITGTLAKVKAVFNWAVFVGWIERSPLDGVSGGGYQNEETEMFVPISVYRRMLEHCPDYHWATLLTLLRIGGLRPCEAMILKWESVDFTGERILIQSPKTKRYKGKEQRFIPLFPEIKQALKDLANLPESKGREYVVNLPGYSNREKANPGPKIKSIAEEAGLKEFPRPCDNLRASRSNEVRRYFDDSLEVAWIGHSKEIRQEYYDMVIDCDYRQAANWTTPIEDSILPFEGAGKTVRDSSRKGAIA